MNRLHSKDASFKACTLLKDNGFKIDVHILLDCPGTSIQKDLESTQTIIKEICPDYIKIYICVDVPFTLNRQYKQNAFLYSQETKEMILKWMSNGQWVDLQKFIQVHNKKSIHEVYIWESIAETNYPDFVDMMLKVIDMIPSWMRINRFHRDFPRADTTALRLGYESDVLCTNFRQLCMKELEKYGKQCKDIRARELRNRSFHLSSCEIHIYQYHSLKGTDYFISVEEVNDDQTFIVGMIRLRMMDWDMNPLDTMSPQYLLDTFRFRKTIRVRELHVYGNLSSSTGFSTSSFHYGQHQGIGKFLLQCAETIGLFLHMDQIAVISGVGVQQYYYKLGYTLSKSDEYMIKSLHHQSISKRLYIHDYYIYSSDLLSKKSFHTVKLQKVSWIIKNYKLYFIVFLASVTLFFLYLGIK
jgi:elongator complex protein 3